MHETLACTEETISFEERGRSLSGAVWSLELLQELLHPDRPAHHLIAAPATNLATGAKVRKSRRKIRSFKVENLNLRW